MPKQIKLITPANIPLQKDEIHCNSRILTLGSCFSDHIGNCLSDHLFDAMVNPFGTVFNPISIANVLELAINKNLIKKSDLQHENNRFFHYDFHSSFDSSSSQKAIDGINLVIKNVGEFIQNIDILILTFGTSIVYKLKANNQIVSNCHKMGNHNFQKEFISVDFMEENMNRILESIKKLTPSVKTIFTVSPVRHTKEGLVGNNRSKSRLIELCHRLVQNDSTTSYFPSYEIMIDELRDYRYYALDLIHPSDLAVDIIWSRFIQTYFDSCAIQKVQDIKELNAAKNHVPFDPISSEHQKFKQNQLIKIERLSQIYPEIDFREMEEFFKM